MSTLTKVCVVVLVLLVLGSCLLFIPKSVMDPGWRTAYFDQATRAQVASVQFANQQLAAAVWKKYYEQAVIGWDADAEKSKSLQAAKDVEINRLAQLHAQAASELTGLKVSFEALQKDVQSQIAMNKTLSTQLQAQRDQYEDQGKQLRLAHDALRESEAKVDILTKSTNALQEQLADRNREIEDLRARLEGGPGKEGPGVAVRVPAPKIEATVTGVKTGLASLNVGSADGVQKGMEFIIYRNANFVAHLRIAEVYASSSAGVITDAQRDVQQGDKATTKLE